MKLQPQEAELVGKWIVEGKIIRADAVCERIEWLVKNTLKQIAISPESGGWEILFQDSADGRYWEHTYSQSEMHGGGPPS